MNLSVSDFEITQIANGTRTIETIEIHPISQSKFVQIDSDGAIIGIIPYCAIAFVASKCSLLVEIKGAKLYEVTNNHGDLLFYEYLRERHQQINLDYHLGGIIRAHNIELKNYKHGKKY